ncbi:DUF6036 family nucleotidyltransferase [Lysinibacillus sp. UGB7]|uniref:DUF6036 family nucleotidyltransferase n=1 Tax=Lysinibacillus sp. UGB7 TaxID=3411039 RepID=UPI003B82B5CC
MTVSREELIKNTKQKLLALASIKEQKFKVMMEAAKILTEHMEHHNPYNRIHAQPIIVGGLSVEIYTQNNYTTRDIDIVSSSSIRLREDLKDMGFDKSSRVFVLEELELVIDVVDSELYGDYDKVTKFQFIDENGEEAYVYVISIEDIILDRLDGSEHETNRYWGFNMLSRYFHMVDLDYMKKEVSTKYKSTQEMFDSWVEVIEKEKEKQEE